MGKVKNWTTEKKDEIERILINMWAGQGMNIPNNYKDIVQYCYEDICETADIVNWNDSDVSIAFRRWIEAQAISDKPKQNDEFEKDECTNGLHIPSYQCPNIWGEIRSDFLDDDIILYINAWLTDDDNEEGKVIAKMNVQTKEIEYLDDRARTDFYAQEIINEHL